MSGIREEKRKRRLVLADRSELKEACMYARVCVFVCLCVGGCIRTHTCVCVCVCLGEGDCVAVLSSLAHFSPR